MNRIVGAIALVSTVSLAPSTAVANGRFPQAHVLVEDPTDPNHLVLGATYGLLVTKDRGKNWYSICEQAFALRFLEGNPLLEIMPDGTLLSGIRVSGTISQDCGCSWQPMLAAPEWEFVLDTTTDRDGTLIALVQDTFMYPGVVRLDESTDGGKTWRKFSDLPANITQDASFTVDAAPSNPSRLYVSAYGGQSMKVGVLLVSDDRGATWRQHTIPNTNVAILPFIAAVHPTNPDRIFVRTDDWLGFTPPVSANDALLYSADGGATWTELIRRNAKLFGFALSPDGGTVLAGYGDPVGTDGRSGNPDDFGIYRASTDDFAFQRILHATVGCLRWTGQGLYVCTVERHPKLPSPGMGLAFAANADFTEATAASALTSLLDSRQVRGPLGCTAAVCGDPWAKGVGITPAVCQQLTATCGVDATMNTLACANPPPATGGAAGTGGAPGTGNTGGAAGTKGGSNQAAGCGCSLSAGSGAPFAWTAIAIALWALNRSRFGRRRRR